MHRSLQFHHKIPFLLVEVVYSLMWFDVSPEPRIPRWLTSLPCVIVRLVSLVIELSQYIFEIEERI